MTQLLHINSTLLQHDNTLYLEILGKKMVMHVMVAGTGVKLIGSWKVRQEKLALAVETHLVVGDAPFSIFC